MENTQYLNTEKQNDTNSTSAISNLALKIVNACGSKANHMCDVRSDVSPSALVDIIRYQWKMYQLGQIPKSMYLQEQHSIKGRNQNSYREYALGYCGIFPSEQPREEESQFLRLDDYWRSVNLFLNEDGKPKYDQLFSLAKAVLSISHGNVVPERGFSINKYMLPAHRNAIQEDTLVSLRLIKDQLCLDGGLSNFKVATELLKSIKTSSARYQKYLQVKRELKEKEERRRLQKEQEKAFSEKEVEKGNTISMINKYIEYIKDSIRNVEETLREANDDIAKSLKGGVFRKEDIQKAHTIIQMNLDRKRVLESSLDELALDEDETNMFCFAWILIIHLFIDI